MQELFSVRLGFAGTAYLSRFGDALEPIGLTPGRLLALAYVRAHPGCDQNSLARALTINKASAMSIVDRLQGQGFLMRRSGADRRSNALHLTADGKRAFDLAMEVEQAVHAELFGWMSAQELKTLAGALDEIVRRASAVNDPQAADTDQASSGIAD